MRQAILLLYCNCSYFELTSLCMNWYIESLSAVVNCFGYCNVLHSYRKPASPRARSSTFAAALPLLYCRLVGSFLHHTPNAVINRIKVRAIGWPHIRTSEFESFTTKQLHCFTYTISRLFVLLKDVKIYFIESSPMLRMAGSTPVHLDSRLCRFVYQGLQKHRYPSQNFFAIQSEHLEASTCCKLTSEGTIGLFTFLKF